MNLIRYKLDLPIYIEIIQQWRLSPHTSTQTEMKT
jgi:hypothetical protein